ncbi:hypothetical protein F5Y11DRAFT_321691 [Daldinia sp. FL1419]|nr:hypothetical protein F5Y11DRAFT_321691 [Daldinia sp. FL1419]
MRSISILVSAISLVTAISHSVTPNSESHQVLSDGLPNGYSLANITWVGKVEDDIHSFTGPNISNIKDQIREIYPNFSWDGPGKGNLASRIRGRTPPHLLCDPSGVELADAYRIQEGVNYLKGVTGTCHLGPGPKVCTRISCSWNSAIWWCNDNSHDIRIDCRLWSEYSQNILDLCQTEETDPRVMGQKFMDRQKWNILVGHAEC